MLINWELAAPNFGFAIRVGDVRAASAFYRAVLGAQETFRRITDDGVLVRAGLAAGAIQFVLSSHADEGPETASLSRLAAELGVPYLAIILHVDNPKGMALAAMQNGAVLKEAPDSEDVIVVADPFGGHWAFINREPADSLMLSLGDHRPAPRKSTLH